MLSGTVMRSTASTTDGRTQQKRIRVNAVCDMGMGMGNSNRHSTSTR